MIGLCSVTFRERQPEEVIKMAQKAGLDCIEWESKQHVPSNDLSHASKVRKLTLDAGLKISSYGTYYQVGSKNEFEPIVDTAEVLGTKMIRVWAGNKGSEELDDEWFNKVVDDTHRIAKMAEEKGLSISFEYHSGTLTDTPESAHQLMDKIKADNVFLYWQPAETLSIEERLESLELLGKWLSNIHVFNWQDYHNRFTLNEGKEEWIKYLSVIKDKSPNEPHLLLEFVKENSPQQLLDDAETLKEISGIFE